MTRIPAPRIPTSRILAAACAALLALGAAAPASAQAMQDETRDRVLLIHRERGTLAPGTRPKCFPSAVDDNVARSQFQCPWDAPNGQPRYPTIRSFWGLTGNY